MKTLTVAALVCALMALTGALPLSPEETETTSPVKISACPNDWTEISGRCFRFISCALSWAEAERHCLSMGANLASIHSASEYHDVQRVIAAATHDYRVAWVGGSDAQQNDIWFWTDGTKFHYNSWCPGEPNNAGGQACLQMNYSARKCWDDDHCTYQKPFVCSMTPK